MSDVMTLYLVRHGVTDSNKKRVMQGALDTPLNAEGEAQAQRIARRLSVTALDQIISSDLKRAYRTAELIQGAQREPVPHLVDPRVREIDGGIFEGLGFAEMQALDPEAFALLDKAPGRFAAPEGESAAQVRDRALAFYAELWPQYRGKTVLVASHGYWIQVLLHSLTGAPIETMQKQIDQNCSLTELAVTGADAYELKRRNDVAHLED